MKLEDIKIGMKVTIENHKLNTDSFVVVKIDENTVSVRSDNGYLVELIKPELLKELIE